jgi:hypothetical protein
VTSNPARRWWKTICSRRKKNRPILEAAFGLDSCSSLSEVQTANDGTTVCLLLYGSEGINDPSAPAFSTPFGELELGTLLAHPIFAGLSFLDGSALWIWLGWLHQFGYDGFRICFNSGNRRFEIIA